MLGVAALLVALLAVLLSAAAAWLMTPAGLRWLATTAVPDDRLIIEGISGHLLGPLNVSKLSFASERLRVQAEGLRLEWRPAALLRGRVDIVALSAERLDIVLPPAAPGPPPTLPESVALPLPLDVGRLQVGVLRVLRGDAAAPLFVARSLKVRLAADRTQYDLYELAADVESPDLPQPVHAQANGRLAASRPFALSGEAKLLATLEQLVGDGALEVHTRLSGTLSQLQIQADAQGGEMTGAGEARLEPFAALPLAALQLKVAGLDPRRFSERAPKALLDVEVDLQPSTDQAVGSDNRPASTPPWQLAGTLAVTNHAAAPFDRDGLPLAHLRAAVTLSAQAVRLADLDVRPSGRGKVGGQLAWRRAEQRVNADLTLHDVDLASLDARLRRTSLDGSAKLAGDASAQRGEIRLTDGDLRLEAKAARAGDTVELEHATLRRGRAALTGHGRLNLAGERAVTFAGRLREFDLSAFARAPASRLNADFDLAGRLSPEPAGRLRFAIADSRLAGQPVSGQGDLTFKGLDAAGGAVQLRVGDNRLDAHGEYGLSAAGDAARDTGVPPGRGRLELRIDAPALAQLGPDFAGALSLQATIAGRSEGGKVVPQSLQFAASSRGLRLPNGDSVAQLTANGELDGEDFRLALTLHDFRQDELEETPVEAQGKAPRVQQLDLAVDGKREQHALRLVAKLAREQNVELKAVGGLSGERDWAERVWRGKLTELVTAGPLVARLVAPAEVVLARDKASLGEAAIAVGGGRVEHAGSEWTPSAWQTRGRFTGIEVRPAVLQARPSPVRGRDEAPPQAIRLGGDWQFAQGAAPRRPLRGHVSVQREAGDWALPGDDEVLLGISELRLSARLDGGRLRAELLGRGTRLGDWQGSLNLALSRGDSGWAIADSAPLDGKLAVALPDLAWIGPLFNTNFATGGALDLHLDVGGSFGAPRFTGEARGERLLLALLDQGLRLQDGQLRAHFEQERLLIDQLEFVAPHGVPPRRLRQVLPFRAGAGSVGAQGSIDFAERSGAIEVSADRLPLTQRADRWIIASGRVRAGLAGEQLIVRGNLTTDAGLVGQPEADRPQLPDDVVVIGQATPAGRGTRLEMDVGVDLGEHFYVQASGVESRLAGRLRLLAEPGRPLRANGSIATQEGTVEAYGQRLTIERGIVNFQGPLDDPGLNVYALRKGLPVEAGVEVTGTVRRPQVRLVSVPPVPDPEKLSWLVLGRAPDTSGGNDAAMLLPAAGALFGGQSESITSQIARSVGIDEFTLRQGETQEGAADARAGDTLTNQIVSVGKRLSSRATLSYEQGLAAAAGLVKLTYQLTPRVSVVTRAGTDNAIDIFYTLSFD